MATAVCGSAYRADPDQFRGCAEIRRVVGSGSCQTATPPAEATMQTDGSGVEFSRLR